MKRQDSQLTEDTVRSSQISIDERTMIRNEVSLDLSEESYLSEVNDKLVEVVTDPQQGASK